jgi:hypothetical protein
MLKKILQHCGLDDTCLDTDFPENFFPIPENYIVFQTGSERKSQVYDLSPEVLSLISSDLKSNNITVIQVGDSDDPSLRETIDLRSKLTVRQLAYIIKNSKLCITSNQLSSRLCKIYKKDLILLGSNFPSRILKPVFDKVSFIEPELKTPRWNYQSKENPKNINLINPEIVASEILKKLNIKDTINFKSLFIGEKYSLNVLNIIPEYDVNLNGSNFSISIRLDIFYNPSCLHSFLNRTKAEIVTKKSFTLENLNLQNINALIYLVEDDLDLDFIKSCISKLVNIVVVCENEDNIKEMRFKTLGICTIYKKPKQIKLDIKENNAIFFKSNRVFINGNKIYSSLFHYKNNIEKKSVHTELTKEILENEDFLENKDYSLVFKHES